MNEIRLSLNDVIFGKRGLYTNAGMIRLREIMNQHFEAHFNADRYGRRKIVDEIIVQLKRELPPGAKLLKFSPPGSYNLMTNNEVPTAISKLLQGMRSSRKQRKNAAVSNASVTALSSKQPARQDSNAQRTPSPQQILPRPAQALIDIAGWQNNHSNRQNNHSNEGPIRDNMLNFQQPLNGYIIPSKIREPQADSNYEKNSRQPSCTVVNGTPIQKTSTTTTNRPNETIITMGSHQKPHASLQIAQDYTTNNIVPTYHDVVFGRGVPIGHTAGSDLVRKILKENIQAHTDAATQKGKRQVRQAVSRHTKNALPHNARFLQLVPAASSGSSEKDSYRCMTYDETLAAIDCSFLYFIVMADWAKHDARIVSPEPARNLTTNNAPANSTPRRLEQEVAPNGGQNNDSPKKPHLQQPLNPSNASNIQEPPADAQSASSSQPCTPTIRDTSSSTKRSAETVTTGSNKKARVSLKDSPLKEENQLLRAENEQLQEENVQLQEELEQMRMNHAMEIGFLKGSGDSSEEMTTLKGELEKAHQRIKELEGTASDSADAELEINIKQKREVKEEEFTTVQIATAIC